MICMRYKNDNNFIIIVREPMVPENVTRNSEYLTVS